MTTYSGTEKQKQAVVSAKNAALHCICNILIVLNSHTIFVGQIPSNVTEKMRKFQVKLDLMQNKLITRESLKINKFFFTTNVFSQVPFEH